MLSTIPGTWEVISKEYLLLLLTTASVPSQALRVLALEVPRVKLEALGSFLTGDFIVMSWRPRGNGRHQRVA